MTSHPTTSTDAPAPLVLDRFRTDAPKGSANATSDSASPHAARLVTDAERIISIDHDALRIPMLATPGFGRAALSYGPFNAAPGLALAVWMLNGHNTSQTLHTYSLLKQSYRFLRGGNALSIPQQLAGWARHPARESLLRRIHCWIGVRRAKDAAITDNLMVGFFADANSPTLGPQGHAFVMHAASHECGDLRVTHSPDFTPNTNAGTSVLLGFQNVEALFLIVLRENSALHYLAATPGARGAPTPASMRPVAIVRHLPAPPATRVYAGIHQSVLGEIGFAVDSRIQGVAVAHLPHLTQPFAGAHASENLGHWSRDAHLRWTTPPAPSGLLAAQVGHDSALLFRFQNADNHWRAAVHSIDNRPAITLSCVVEGTPHEIATAQLDHPSTANPIDLLILDDGHSISLRANGHTVGTPTIPDDRLANHSGVGLLGTAVSSFEAHPREVPIPQPFRLRDFWTRSGHTEILRDHFLNASGDLHNRSIPNSPNNSWQRTFGSGHFDLLPAGGAKVRGQPGNPCPTRTLYTTAWNNPAFADIQTTMTPPGTARFQRQGGRSGLVLWQDPRNHLIVNLWLHDGYAGASISSFLVVSGFDDVYNAVWTNIGPRVQWNTPFRLGVAFDGDHYLVRVNDEPVLVRRVTDVYPKAPRFNITRVGLAANWEWGLDTGTTFHDFIARA